MSFQLHMDVFTAGRGFSLTNYAIGIMIIMTIISWIRTRSLSYVICAAIFGIYLLFVIDKTFFPLHIAGNYADAMRAVPFMLGVNLIPFNFRYSPVFSRVVRELALNFALLAPFDFGINFLAHFRSRAIFWLAPAVGVSIEAIQLVISLIIGYPYRVIDVTDVIMNTLGFLAGYGLFRLFVWLYMAMTHRLNIEYVGLGKYIYHVANRSVNTGGER